MKHTFHLTQKEAHDALREYFDLHKDAEIIIEEPVKSRKRREIFVNYQTTNTHPDHLDPNQKIEVMYHDGRIDIDLAKNYGVFWNMNNVMRPSIYTYRLID